MFVICALGAVSNVFRYSGCLKTSWSVDICYCRRVPAVFKQPDARMLINDAVFA